VVLPQPNVQLLCIIIERAEREAWNLKTVSTFA